MLAWPHYQWFNHLVVIYKLCGEAAGIILALFRFPVSQVCPDLPDDPAVI